MTNTPKGCASAFYELQRIIADPDLSFTETVAALEAVKAEADRLLAIADPVPSTYASPDHKHNYAPNYYTECGLANKGSDNA